MNTKGANFQPSKRGQFSAAVDMSGHSVATYRCYRANGIGPKSWKCGRYVKYWRADVLAWMAAQEATTARGGVQ
ncbi:DNA-binding protein [Mycobacterium sherrisii]|uniref:DNA-binding protein n=1 Tax=Mycobacterium sherrisii TaxID=243061 RepID=UPI00397484DF